MNDNDTQRAQRQAEQHEFFEKLMSEMNVAVNSKLILDRFFSIRETDYFEYLKKVCSPEDIEKFDPDGTLIKLERIAETYNIFNNIDIGTMVAIANHTSNVDDISFIIDKLLLEPFRMLRKENKT